MKLLNFLKTNSDKIIKGLLLMVGVILAALQSPPIVWAVTISTAILTGIGYFIKNFYVPSTSTQGAINFADIVATLMLAAVAALSDSISSWIVNGAILWSLVGKTVLNVVITYMTTTFFSGNKPT